MLAYGSEKDLIIQLLDETPQEHLEKRNDVCDTALHVAVANDQVEVATKMIQMNNNLVYLMNNWGQTPLHKFALFGQTASFRMLIKNHSDPWARTVNGSTVLHCAIMGNNPGIPLIKKSSVIVGKAREGNIRDVERQGNYWKDETDYEDALEESLTKSSKTLPTYSKVFLLNVAVSNSVKKLEEQKNNHAQNLKLVAYLARYQKYWSFMVSGMNPENEMGYALMGDSDLDYGNNNEEVDNDDDDHEIETSKEFQKKMVNDIMVGIKKYMGDKKANGPTRWYDSPLIVGAKEGLYDFVAQILKVYPESAQYKDLEGKNVLQVAIKHRHEKIVNIIIDMATRKSPVLPSSLLSVEDKKAPQHNPALCRRNKYQ
ncbi:hypothetical protein J5N97_022717 [Dioscorea zingiberensis]|uniref:Uncharacterized protein n=1 Tax=Dioscorea zingiberensis TaxID=325984 RepID=A0A9D5HB60_9LILI|nr:hypothetical protein J5N97_022717 [Dioscorea zingiberensis]